MFVCDRFCNADRGLGAGGLCSRVPVLASSGLGSCEIDVFERVRQRRDPAVDFTILSSGYFDRLKFW